MKHTSNPDEPIPEPKNISKELRKCPQWVCWQYEQRADTKKPTKVPKIPDGSGANAKSSDSSTWGTFPQALATAQRMGWGVGFMFSSEDPYAGIDLDDALTGPETPAEWVPDLTPFIDAGAYIQRSPSGNGLHVILKEQEGARIPNEYRNKKAADGGREVMTGTETRFFTITGDIPAGLHTDTVGSLGTPELLLWLQGAWNALGTKRPEEAAQRARMLDSAREGEVDIDTSSGLTDNELLSRAMNAENGSNFQALWLGDTSGYPSHSEADLALCNHLAFWTGCQLERIDRLFRQSGLMRDKWERDDYRERTINAALRNTSDVYDPYYTSGGRTDGEAELTALIDNRAKSDGGVDVAADADVDVSASVPTNPTEWTDVLQQLRSSDKGTTGTGLQLAAMLLIDELNPITVEKTGEIWRYNPETGIYSPDGSARIREALARHLGPELNTHRVREVENSISWQTYVTLDDLQPQKGLICVGNGVLDLTDPAEPRLLPYSSDYRFITRLPVDYRPGAPCPEFSEFLTGSCISSDRAKLQEYAGYCLYMWGQPYKRAMVLLGPTDSGKSTFLSILREVFGGTENVASESLQNLAHTRWGTYELLGRAVNIRNEISGEDLKNTSLIKEITSGRDRISAEQKGQAKISFVPTTKHLYASNSVPAVENGDAAFYNRWLFVSFPRTIPSEEQDTELDVRIIENELSGVLNWMVEGYARLRQQNGFSNELTVEEKKEMWTSYGDSVDRFIATCLEITNNPTDQLAKSDIWEVYKRMCHAIGGDVEPQTTFTKRLKEQEGVTDGQARMEAEFTENSRPYVYRGIQLTQEGNRHLNDSIRARENARLADSNGTRETGLGSY